MAVKDQVLCVDSQPKLIFLRPVGESGIPGGAVKCVDIRRNTGGEGDSLGRIPDAEVRKPGEQTGLDTPVVLAVNDGY